MSLTPQERQRLDELLADRAVFGLDEAEQRELQQLQDLATVEDDVDADAYEFTAARVLLAHVDQGAQPPDSLAQDVADEAEAFFENRPTLAAASENWSSFRERMAWIVAAACMLVLAVLGWRESTGLPQGPLPLQLQRTRLLQEAEDAVLISWLPSKDPAAESVVGDVLWSNQRQQGYMLFRGLKPNNPSQQQYQLWIIDGARNAAQPVDGGVFDIPSGADEVVVPISSKLQVYDPKAFAVTIEKPGGVVVSDRERLALLATVSQD